MQGVGPEDAVLGLADRLLQHQDGASDSAVDRHVKQVEAQRIRYDVAPCRSPEVLEVDGFRALERQVRDVFGGVAALADSEFRFAAWIAAVRYIAPFMTKQPFESVVEVHGSIVNGKTVVTEMG